MILISWGENVYELSNYKIIASTSRNLNDRNNNAILKGLMLTAAALNGNGHIQLLHGDFYHVDQLRGVVQNLYSFKQVCKVPHTIF